MHNFLPVLAAMAVAASCLLLRRRGGGALFAATGPGDDEDMKIASEHFSRNRRGEDAAELAAQDFLRQKELGNIDRARELGVIYAQAVLDRSLGPLAGEMEGRSPRIRHQQYLLYSYVVSHVIADHSPNSILAQTSLNVFYGELESNSPELYRHVSDMAAFSLYILCERSKNRSDEEFGFIFADLCGEQENRALVKYGNELYEKFYGYCIDRIREAGYRD